MNYRSFGKLGFEVSALGMGCMRLPRIYHESGPASIDKEKAFEMIRYAAENGVNYFDTAFTYHHGSSEAVLGEALETYKLRDKVKIVTKQLFMYMKTQDDIRRNLESALTKLRTSRIDVYLIHSITGGVWEDIKRRDIIGEYEKFRSEGLIGAIGFSYHGKLGAFKDVLGYYGWDMCQVQQNLLDADKEVTEEAIALAGKKGTALAIMEPLKGGGLANAPAAVKEIYGEYHEERTPAEWAFRHVLNYPAVSTVLSGMTTMEQLKENIQTFSRPDAVANSLSEEERRIIARAKAAYESYASIPCTACEYCMPCPKGVNIPKIFSDYNEGVMFGDFSQPQRSYMMLERSGGKADNCVQCGVCSKKCPQFIDIPGKIGHTLFVAMDRYFNPATLTYRVVHTAMVETHRRNAITHRFENYRGISLADTCDHMHMGGFEYLHRPVSRQRRR